MFLVFQLLTAADKFKKNILKNILGVIFIKGT